MNICLRLLFYFWDYWEWRNDDRNLSLYLKLTDAKRTVKCLYFSLHYQGNIRLNFLSYFFFSAYSISIFNTMSFISYLEVQNVQKKKKAKLKLMIPKEKRDRMREILNYKWLILLEHRLFNWIEEFVADLGEVNTCNININFLKGE